MTKRATDLWWWLWLPMLFKPHYESIQAAQLLRWIRERSADRGKRTALLSLDRDCNLRMVAGWLGLGGERVSLQNDAYPQQVVRLHWSERPHEIRSSGDEGGLPVASEFARDELLLGNATSEVASAYRIYLPIALPGVDYSATYCRADGTVALSKPADSFSGRQCIQLREVLAGGVGSLGESAR